MKFKRRQLLNWQIQRLLNLKRMRNLKKLWIQLQRQQIRRMVSKNVLSQNQMSRRPRKLRLKPLRDLLLKLNQRLLKLQVIRARRRLPRPRLLKPRLPPRSQQLLLRLSHKRLNTHLPTKRYKPKLKVIRVIPIHQRVKAKKNNLKLKLPQPKRLPPLRRSKSRLHRKKLLRNPRRSKKRKRALTLVTKAERTLRKANNKIRTLKIANKIPHLIPILDQMTKKMKENPRNDHN